MKQPIPCHHCGRMIRPVSTSGHPWQHVDTGQAHCADAVRATPHPDYVEAA